MSERIYEITPLTPGPWHWEDEYLESKHQIVLRVRQYASIADRTLIAASPLLLEAAEAAAPVINGMVLEMELTDPPEADGAADAFEGELRQLHQLHDQLRTAINAAKGNQ